MTKWKSAKIACMNKVCYIRLSSVRDHRDYIFKKFGSKQYIYECNQGKDFHYHLTTIPIKSPII